MPNEMDKAIEQAQQHDIRVQQLSPDRFMGRVEGFPLIAGYGESEKECREITREILTVALLRKKKSA